MSNLHASLLTRNFIKKGKSPKMVSVKKSIIEGVHGNDENFTFDLRQSFNDDTKVKLLQNNLRRVLFCGLFTATDFVTRKFILRSVDYRHKGK